MARADEKDETLPPLELVLIAPVGRVEARLNIEIRQSVRRDVPTILCLHGIGSNTSGYRAQLEGLSDRYHVVAWNAPGYGRSDSLPFEVPHAEDYAHALAGLIRALELPGAIVAGSSFGAVIAAYFAAMYPDLTPAIILSAPAAGNARLPEDERRTILDKRVNDMKRLGPHGVADQRSVHLVAPDAPQEIVAAAHRLVAATNPAGYIQAAHVLDSADTVTIAEQVAVPTLVLVGGEDKVTPAETCARPIYERLRHGELLELDGVGHLIKLEAPQVFNEKVADFLARHDVV